MSRFVFLFPRFLMLALVSASLLACSNEPDRYAQKISGNTMGTYYQLTIVTDETFNAEPLKSEVDELLDNINASMSTYIAESEISQFNHSNSAKWHSVSPDFAKVTAQALTVYEQTQGKFDPTLGPVINLWSFGEQNKPAQVPTRGQITQAQEKVGGHFLAVRHDPPALKKTNPDLALDLSANAKGFAVDRISLLLDAKNIEHYLVDIGGELRAKGQNIQSKPWQVAIEKPQINAKRALQQIVSISDKSIATSGSYRNYFEEDGRRYSHIIDATTFMPITHKLVSVSVLSDEAMVADSYATALMAMGPEEGYQFALQYDLAVYMIEKQGEQFIAKATPKMQSYME